MALAVFSVQKLFLVNVFLENSKDGIFRVYHGKALIDCSEIKVVIGIDIRAFTQLNFLIFLQAIALFWPLFGNTSEPLEIRVSAMNALITTLPSSARLLSFFWHMKKESNYHLYNFFYTTVHSYANTKYPCYHKL